ncbi:Calcium channel YVC1 [Erysiphe necator]|uniref:Putative integral membrane channel protein n=1 Tax=Uncinula necator TaxID=52586 RepID=A0A0B1PFH2_UNCNE|nr:Calcium channel YVC1 [Erysiphe necator]KHJ35294.1 putative integral membrane channel protein [Erysiphe necator]
MLYHPLRSKKRPRVAEEEPGIFTPYSQQRHAAADFSETGDDLSNDEEQNTRRGQDIGDDDTDEENEDGERHPLLPIFSAAHLDALPVYSLTHAIRLIVLPRTETTLTWDQLRSPQVSQFLVKPMQQQIRTSHFSRATLYALMANCLQFQKESQSNPGTSGTSKTRAMVCELLAIKLLKEFNIRELIDALSYDFFPLQGLEQVSISSRAQQPRDLPAIVRISTLEIAIRASAKRFLSQPLVIQQLESIWAGTIVFHSHADNLHRKIPNFNQKKAEPSNLQVPKHDLNYGTSHTYVKQNEAPQFIKARRTATIYDPRDASLLKLSRLRVPRYRQFFSTCSFAILLGLFVAVLHQRSMDIKTLEVIFWSWSAGFMLDEVVGFNEQGFSLYIMSFWNAFDLGILLLLSIYYCMRLYGIFLVDIGRKEWNSMAYDVLATSAILLFPRLFSVLDHYRYFSQLLIAFRLMAIDLVAVFVLILIACSGFFVAFTLSFSKDEYDAADVAYRIFQILMGFTPAAWDFWTTYNPLGRALLILFLFTCHFLVVTILITVLTNSFMAIVSNADQEHQFVFAVNTISMVKNDALFSYVAPSNVLAWLLTPMRLCLPFRLYIKLNRTAIKFTHFPLLFGIFIYEKLFLSDSVYQSTDLVENVRKGGLSFQDPTARLRQESAAEYKDQALDEVFRLQPKPDTLRKSMQQMNTLNVVNNWMNQQSDLEDSSLAYRMKRRTPRFRRAISGNKSTASDPIVTKSEGVSIVDKELNDETYDDGDDELNTNDETQDEISHCSSTSNRGTAGFFPMSRTVSVTSLEHLVNAKKKPKDFRMNSRSQNRNLSESTIALLSAPNSKSSASILKSKTSPLKHPIISAPESGLKEKNTQQAKSYPRSSIMNRGIKINFDSTILPKRQIKHRRSSLEMGTSQIGIDSDILGAVPNSFATQMAMATGGLKNTSGDKNSDDMMGRLMLARMKNLEEGFAEILKEFRVMRPSGNSSTDHVEKGKERHPRRIINKPKFGSLGSSGRSKA